MLNQTNVKKNLAREFRKDPTLSEKILWHCLKNRSFLNLKFRRQHGFDGFIVDLYCHSLKMVIEIDGGIHEYQKDYDKLRQKIIEERGIIFYRVSSEEVVNDVEAVLDNIEFFINNKLPPRPLGEGVRG